MDILLGEKLGHSYSPRIHSQLGDYAYDLYEKRPEELEDFLKKIPELEKQGYEQLSARNKALGGTVTYYQQTWMVGKDGSIQSTVYSVTETGITNAERMKKSMDERLEKQKKKKLRSGKRKKQSRLKSWMEAQRRFLRRKRRGRRLRSSMWKQNPRWRQRR